MLANRSLSILCRYWQVLLATFIALAPLSIVDAKCRYLPQYINLQPSLEPMQPAEAAEALEKYAMVNENRDPCELQEIDRRLSELERSMFDLSTGSTTLKSHLVLRCREIDRASLRCNGPREDRTDSPEALQIQPLPAPYLGRVFVSIRRSDTTLEVLYATTPEDIREERPPERLTGKSNLVLLPKTLEGKVLIGIFKTKGLWPYRKVLWYF